MSNAQIQIQFPEPGQWREFNLTAVYRDADGYTHTDSYTQDDIPADQAPAQREINAKEASIAAAKADQASALAADERRQNDLKELASQRKKVQNRWRDHYDQLTAGQDYKDHETPRLKRLLTEGQHMASAGYMSEQDSVRLGQMRDEALKGLPKEIRTKVKWMVDDMIKGYSKAAAGERELMTPLERKDLEASRYKAKLDGLSDIVPSLPKDGAAAKIVATLKDVSKYGVLNDATIKQLQSLSMRIPVHGCGTPPWVAICMPGCCASCWEVVPAWRAGWITPGHLL